MDVIRFVKPGEVIFTEGSTSDGAYIIVSGSVEISKQDYEGRKKVVATLRKHEIFGEMGLIDGLPRSATVTALENCQIASLDKDNFENIVKHNPQALVPLLKVLTARLRYSTNLHTLGGS